MDSQGPNYFDSIPTEISCQILEELLALHKTGVSITQLPSSASQPKYAFHSGVQLQVLRVSKRMHTLGKSVLDYCNEWIVLDMDYAHVLTVWASAFLEMIVVDPESAQDLPSGMMHIRVRPYVSASAFVHHTFVKAGKNPVDCKIILLPASQLSKFVSALRIMELANVPRAVQGKLYQNKYTNEEFHLKQGEHGLSILIHVNEGYPRSIVNNCLEQFRKFHSPLNQVSIVGAPDEQQAESIEASISLPRDVAREPTFSEVVMHIIDLIAMAEAKVDEGMGVCVPKLYEQARAMLVNTHNNDKTPWAGWITNIAAKDWRFEMVVMCASSMNIMVRHILTGGSWLFTSAAQTYGRHMSADVQGLLRQSDVLPQLRAYIYLLNGLHCVLSAKVGDDRNIDLNVVFHGLDLIKQSRIFSSGLPSNKLGVFRTAYDMHERISSEGIDYQSKPKIEAYITGYAKWFIRNLKPAKWRVHESHIPQRLLNMGVLSKMKKESLLTNQELDEYLIIDTFIVHDGAQGEFYLV